MVTIEIFSKSGWEHVLAAHILRMKVIECLKH